MRNFGRILWLLSVALLFLTITAGSAVAAALTLNGLWRYQNSDSADDAFTEQYAVDFNHTVVLTEASDTSFDIRYNRNVQVDETRELLSPTLNLSVVNDIFTFRLSGAATERINSQSADLSSRSVQGVWNSVWQKRFWPTLQLNYNKSWTEDDRPVHQIDTDSWHGSLRTEWDLEKARLFYRFNNSETDDHADLVESTNRRHFARFETAQQFLNNRVAVAFSQQYSLNQNKMISQAGDVFNRIVPDPPSRAGVGLNVATLNWSDLVSPLPTPVSDDSYYIGVDLRSLQGQQFDAIYLYTDRELTTAEWQRFNWALFSNTSPLEVSSGWVPEAAPAVSYDEVQRRFEIVFASTLTDKTFLLLEQLLFPADPNDTTPPVDPVCSFTRMEVYEKVAAEKFERDTTNWQTDIKLGYRLSETMGLSYGLIYESTDVSPGSDFSRRIQTGSMTWLANRYLSTSFDVSDILEKRDQVSDQLNRTYGLTLSSPLLPTLDVGLGLSRGESYSDDEKTATRHNLSLTAAAALYRDLHASLDLSYNTVDNVGSNASSDSLRTRLALTARMNPDLTVTLDEKYTKTSGPSNFDTFDTMLTANWRPSDLLSVRSDGSWLVLDDKQTWQGRFFVFLSLTRKTQTSFGYRIRYVEPEPTDHNYLVNFAWNMNRYFSLNAGGQYQIRGDDEIWSVNSRLSASFSNR
jgi:hypothetical protein